MKTFFSWQPLVPTRAHADSPPGALAVWADWGAILFLGLGVLQILLGFDEGWLRFAPLLIGAFVLGLPHGAIDHLVALGLAGKALRLIPFMTVILLYLVVVLAVLVIWVVLPSFAALGFLVMTIYHWGKSDLIFERLLCASALEFRGAIADGLHAILRGLIPIGLPFLLFPEQATAFLSACVQVFGVTHEVDWALWKELVFAVCVVVFVCDLGVHLAHYRVPMARRIVIENIALILFFCL
ncbi:MAG: beta-carotene 15,15'-dioxygenase, Brp/Blh family, partial [Verrucomicrobiia bacterium]